MKIDSMCQRCSRLSGENIIIGRHNYGPYRECPYCKFTYRP